MEPWVVLVHRSEGQIKSLPDWLLGKATGVENLSASIKVNLPFYLLFYKEWKLRRKEERKKET